MSVPPKAGDLKLLAAILSRLDSPYDGERAAAGLLASRIMRKLGLSWAELLAPVVPVEPVAPPTSTAPQPPNWRDLITECQCYDAALDGWESEFLASLASFSRISARQLSTLEEIADRLGVAR